MRRNRLSTPQVEALATAGAFECFGMERRAALWAAGAVAQSRDDRLEGIVTGADAPPLDRMTPFEEARADLWAVGLSPDSYPTEFVREHLDALGVTTARKLWDQDDGVRIVVGGVVTHRQRPATAGGTIFVNLEDETGLINVICSKGVWARYRRVARSCPALLIRGHLEKADGVINVIAERIEPLPLQVSTKSRDFR